MASLEESWKPVWQQAGVVCVVVPASLGFDVELRNTHGVAFLRKAAATNEAAFNEAEYLRLLLESDHLVPSGADLKPFALVVEDDTENCEGIRGGTEVGRHPRARSQSRHRGCAARQGVVPRPHRRGPPPA